MNQALFKFAAKFPLEQLLLLVYTRNPGEQLIGCSGVVGGTVGVVGGTIEVVGGTIGVVGKLPGSRHYE